MPSPSSSWLPMLKKTGGHPSTAATHSLNTSGRRALPPSRGTSVSVVPRSPTTNTKTAPASRQHARHSRTSPSAQSWLDPQMCRSASTPKRNPPAVEARPARVRSMYSVISVAGRDTLLAALRGRSAPRCPRPAAAASARSSAGRSAWRGRFMSCPRGYWGEHRRCRGRLTGTEQSPMAAPSTPGRRPSSSRREADRPERDLSHCEAHDFFVPYRELPAGDRYGERRRDRDHL